MSHRFGGERLLAGRFWREDFGGNFLGGKGRHSWMLRSAKAEVADAVFQQTSTPQLTDPSPLPQRPASSVLHRSRPLLRSAEAEVADAVFQQAFIPRKLDEVTHFERDRERLAAGHSSEGIYYQVCWVCWVLEGRCWVVLDPVSGLCVARPPPVAHVCGCVNT